MQFDNTWSFHNTFRALRTVLKTSLRLRQYSSANLDGLVVKTLIPMPQASRTDLVSISPRSSYEMHRSAASGPALADLFDANSNIVIEGYYCMIVSEFFFAPESVAVCG